MTKEPTNVQQSKERVFRSLDEFKRKYLPSVAAEEADAQDDGASLGISTTLTPEAFKQASAHLASKG